MADIGLSGIRSRKRTSADQPVASAIGTSGTHARDARRNTSSSTRPTAASPARSVPSRRHGEASAAFASAASTGRPAIRAVTPGGGSSWSRIRSITRACSASGASRIPNARLAVFRSAVMTAWEKYGGTASSSAATFARSEAASPWNRSGSDSAGHRAARPHPFASL